ncbi:putative sugar transporter [Trypanosoma conorhini]|uniref:Putative sugar transporter n=1 Tax=Trypanosoma conorhini TaxID=83891 RepID=A0A3R7LY16_9TRYP|nr:putative sugar transporter [Trypanosoma conorhini]RNF05582.1 putative sugar transporter [Trypanosoma conorhini]
MELRCFLVHCSNPSAGPPYVEIPPSPASHSGGRRGAVKCLGRHSPELYWRLGNNPRFSRRMMSFWVEEATTPEEVPPAARVHPHVAQRLTLKCTGKNTITVARRAASANSSSQPTGESRILLHCNESTTLRVGDSVGVAHQVWMQVVLVLVCVNDAVKVPVVVPQEERSHASCLPVCRTLYSPLRDPPPPPLVHVDRLWVKLPFAIRASLALAAWQHQSTADSGGVVTATATADLPSMASTSLAAPPEIGDGMEEAAALSNSSQVIREGGTTTSSGETRSKRRKRASSSGSRGIESGVLSLDMGPPQKKRLVSVEEGAVMEPTPPPPLPENSTYYYETFDEQLDDELRNLESRATVTNPLIAAGHPVPELLGESPPCEGRHDEAKQWRSRNKLFTVSRTQLRHGNNQREKNLQLSSGHGQVAGDSKTVADESQVVYYRR